MEILFGYFAINALVFIFAFLVHVIYFRDPTEDIEETTADALIFFATIVSRLSVIALLVGLIIALYS
ncbi:hypothetical protein LNK15_03115 [Jeotgalicoccus huakuii]|nr:hypothetical protein [Jeotgalicoccus huakuii]